MIIADVIPGPDCLLLKFSNPQEVFTDQEYKPLRGTLEDVQRMVYFRNRKYITETLGAWLKQRKRAIEARPDQDEFAKKLDLVVSMRDTVLHHQFSSLWALCSYVKRKSGDIAFIAPGETSRHYRFYVSAIVPIINFCSQEGGVQ